MAGQWLQVQPGPEPSLRADPDGLRRLFGNLVKNAAEASTPGTAPVRLSIETLPSSVRVSIRDGGSGIPSVLEGPALTRGLFSTKPGGSGLGLPIAQKIAQKSMAAPCAWSPRPEAARSRSWSCPAEAASASRASWLSPPRTAGAPAG